MLHQQASVSVNLCPLCLIFASLGPSLEVLRQGCFLEANLNVNCVDNWISLVKRSCLSGKQQEFRNRFGAKWNDGFR